MDENWEGGFFGGSFVVAKELYLDAQKVHLIKINELFMLKLKHKGKNETGWDLKMFIRGLVKKL
jgi:hypothetical protein